MLMNRFIGWPTKMSLFSFGNNFCKNKETFKIFSPQILEAYRIPLVQTTQESTMSYYTFLVINDMFDPSTTPLYDSSNSNIKIVHNSTEHFLWNPSDFSSDVVFKNLCCLWIVFINSVFQVSPQKIVRGVEIWGIGWPGVIGSTRNEPVPWEVQPEEFKSSVRAMRRRLILLEHHSVHINASLPSQCRNKLLSHHLVVLLCVEGHTIHIIIFKKGRPEDPPLCL